MFLSDVLIAYVSISFIFCRGRLKHGRHFTFKSVLNDVAVTLVSSSVIGSIADEEHPFAAHGSWLQVSCYSLSKHLTRPLAPGQLLQSVQAFDTAPGSRSVVTVCTSI